MGLSPKLVNAASTTAESLPMPSASRSCNAAPITLKVSQNTSSITPRNTGNAVYLPVSTRSIATERRCSRLSPHLVTDAAATLSIKV